MGLTILYWNTAGRKELAALALEGSREYNAIAISEPWINTYTNGVYCPRRSRYNVIYYSGRAALYIHKRHAAGTWEPSGGCDWCAATFTTREGPITIYSIYSPVESREWISPLTELAEHTPQERSIIVGDFNLHHPLWDREG